MFKSFVIEYGCYVLFGMLAAVIQEYFSVSFWIFWGLIILGMLWQSVLPLIRWLAWGTEH